MTSRQRQNFTPIAFFALSPESLPHVFANLIQLITGRPPHSDIEHPAFVEAVRVYPAEPRNPKVERLILICWILIALKHIFIIWACRHYPVPFHQLWVNFPTWLLGALATGIYFGQVRRS